MGTGGMGTALQRRLAAIVVALMLAVARPHGAALAQAPVDIELVLAVDISLSMDHDELRVQRDGYVAALRDPELHRLMLDGPHRRIAVAYFEWAGRAVQKEIVPWTLIDSPEAALAIAHILEKAPISRERMTSISGALDYAGDLLATSPYKGSRRVVDISGDGPNNNGRPVTHARDELVSKGIVINGLPIMMKQGSTVFDIKDLDIYYEDCVTGGAESFVINIRSLEEMQPAIRRKLAMEVAGLVPEQAPRIIRTGLRPVQQDKAQPRIDCTIGEQLWRRYMDGRLP